MSTEDTSASMLELLTWVAARPRTYAEAMEAWRSTCPRHTVWEDAIVAGFIEVEAEGAQHEAAVTLTSKGLAALNGSASM